MESPSRQPLLAAAGTALAAAAALAVGAAVGRSLLDSMNDADPDVLTTLASHADPDAGPRAVPDTPPHRLVVVVLDGLGEEAFSDALETAHLTDFRWRASVDMGTPSLSRPVYHVLLTGTHQSVSGIGNNTHAGRARADDLATRVREAGGTVGWALEGVPWFHDLFGQPEDTYENAWPRPAARPIAAAERSPEPPAAADPGRSPLIERFAPMARVLAQTSTFALLHFVEIDHAGHSHGAESEEYRRAAADAVQAVVHLRDAHAESPAGPRTVWMLGADHGHRPRGGHGGPEPEVVRTTWLGLWPSAAPRVDLPSPVPADRLAATFAAILGVAPPRMALGDPLPLPDRPAAADPALAARRAARRRAVEDAVREARSAAHRGALTRAGLVALLLTLFVFYRRRELPLVAAAASPTLAACGAFLALGPGLTLSAITTKEGFLARSICVMAGGAALGSLIARRWSPPIRWVLLASGLLPAAAWAVTAGSMGRSRLPDSLLLLFPAAGLVPWGVVAGVALTTVLAGLFDRLRRRPGGPPPSVAREHLVERLPERPPHLR